MWISGFVLYVRRSLTRALLSLCRGHPRHRSPHFEHRLQELRHRQEQARRGLAYGRGEHVCYGHQRPDALQDPLMDAEPQPRHEGWRVLPGVRTLPGVALGGPVGLSGDRVKAPTAIYSIGRSISNIVCRKCDIDLSERTGVLPTDEVNTIVAVVCG